MTTEGLAVGLLVTHRMWGLGKVVHLDPQNVWVYFKDINGTHLKDAVKQLNRRVAVLTIAAKQSDAALDNLPPMVRDGRVAPPHRLRITEQQAVDRFVAKFPRAFDDPAYLDQERDYKWKAHQEVAAELLSVRGRRIVAEGPPGILVNTLKTLIHRTNLLATQELIALNDAFKDQRAARKFADAVLRLVDEGGERAFSGLVEATGSLPADPGRAKVLTWPVVTILPFLAKPDAHMFLKPVQTQKIAEAFTFDLLIFRVPEVDHLRPAADPEQSTPRPAPPSRSPRSATCSRSCGWWRVCRSWQSASARVDPGPRRGARPKQAVCAVEMRAVWQH